MLLLFINSLTHVFIYIYKRNRNNKRTLISLCVTNWINGKSSVIQRNVYIHIYNKYVCVYRVQPLKRIYWSSPFQDPKVYWKSSPHTCCSLPNSWKISLQKGLFSPGPDTRLIVQSLATDRGIVFLFFFFFLHLVLCLGRSDDW